MIIISSVLVSMMAVPASSPASSDEGRSARQLTRTPLHARPEGLQVITAPPEQESALAAAAYLAGAVVVQRLEEPMTQAGGGSWRLRASLQSAGGRSRCKGSFLTAGGSPRSGRSYRNLAACTYHGGVRGCDHPATRPRRGVARLAGGPVNILVGLSSPVRRLVRAGERGAPSVVQANSDGVVSVDCALCPERRRRDIFTR